MVGYSPKYYNGALDQIFVLGNTKGSDDVLEFKSGSGQVEKFWSRRGPKEGLGYNKISDHYGVSLEIKVHYPIALYFYPAIFGYFLAAMVIIGLAYHKDKKEEVKLLPIEEGGSFTANFKKGI
jgi:hypothetical protein